MKPRLSLTRINQLSADSAHCADMVTPGQVDASRPFVPEEHTQLFYTPVYEKLSHEQRLRYNQLFGLRLNEYIMTLEAELIERLLAPLRRHPRVCSDGALPWRWTPWWPKSAATTPVLPRSTATFVLTCIRRAAIATFRASLGGRRRCSASSAGWRSAMRSRSGT